MKSEDRRIGRRTPGIFLVAACAVLLSSAPICAETDLSGRWEFQPPQSDNVHDKIVASLGSASSQGDIRKDSPRLWIRSWLLRQADQPGPLVLTIEQSAKEFKSGLGDEIRTYYFGRESSRQGPGGVLRKATVHWVGERLLVDEKAAKGSGHVLEVYERQADGSLLVTWRLEHDALLQPLALKLVFRKASP